MSKQNNSVRGIKKAPSDFVEKLYAVKLPKEASEQRQFLFEIADLNIALIDKQLRKAIFDQGDIDFIPKYAIKPVKNRAAEIFIQHNQSLNERLKTIHGLTKEA